MTFVRLRWTRIALCAVCFLSGCAAMGAASPEIPTDAEAVTRTESNGDVITEYRVAGQLRIVKVVPSRGPVYFLRDNNGDGRLDTSDGEVSPVYYTLFEWN